MQEVSRQNKKKPVCTISPRQLQSTTAFSCVKFYEDQILVYASDRIYVYLCLVSLNFKIDKKEKKLLNQLFIKTGL